MAVYFDLACEFLHGAIRRVQRKGRRRKCEGRLLFSKVHDDSQRRALGVESGKVRSCMFSKSAMTQRRSNRAMKLSAIIKVAKQQKSGDDDAEEECSCRRQATGDDAEADPKNDSQRRATNPQKWTGLKKPDFNCYVSEIVFLTPSVWECSSCATCSIRQTWRVSRRSWCSLRFLVSRTRFFAMTLASGAYVWAFSFFFSLLSAFLRDCFLY